MNNADRVYKEMLEKELTQINYKITELEQKNKGLRALTDKTTVAIEKLKLQASEIKDQIDNYNERIELGAVSETFVETFDEIVEINDERKQEINANIQELEKVKANLKTQRAIRKIDKKIEYQQKKLAKIQKGNNRISGIQRTFMYSKHKKAMKQQQILNGAQAKVNVADANLKDNQALKEMLDPKNSLKDAILDKVYDIKGQYYQRKKDRAVEVLEQMKKSNSTIKMRGAKAIVITKNLKNKLNKKLEMDKITQNDHAIDQQQVALAAAK